MKAVKPVAVPANPPGSHNFKALLLLSLTVWAVSVGATGLLVQEAVVMDKMDDALVWLHREGVALPTRFDTERAP